MSVFPANIDLSTLNGTTGFKLSGTGANVNGHSVASAGDINGDGFADVIVGAPFANSNGTSSGASYVVFGKAGGFASNIDLLSLDGSNGFRLSGVAADDNSGHSVASAGDINGDGFADLIVGAPGAFFTSPGTSYVVFGKAGGFASNINLSSLDGTTGFKISGTAAGDNSGRSVASAGDVNGDGFADLTVGAPFAHPNGNYSGSSYVLFGKATGFTPNINLSSLDGSNGFRLDGTAGDDQSGFSVASAGDVNGDGFDDVMVGAWAADPNGAFSGASYVVFGKAAAFAPDIDLSSLDGSNGFRLTGAAGDSSGFEVASAGDVNGDGFADLILSARNADPNGTSSGASYVMFGKAAGFASNIDLSSLDGTNGFKLSGAAAYDHAGFSVASAGDVNGDGFADVIVGALGADPNGIRSGASYVVFGKAAGFASNINLSSLDGDNGFRISGAAGEYSGGAVASAGDVNGDGFADLIVKASQSHSGYVVFGRAPDSAVTRTGTDASQTLAGGAFGDTLSGLGGDDELFGNGGGDILDGGAGIDVMRGGAGNDTYHVDSSSDVMIELANKGADTVHTTVSFALGQNVENLVADSDADLTLAGNSRANTITGGAGNDTVTGVNGNDTLAGGDGNDKLVGGNGNDQLLGGDGNDRLLGGTGDDTLDGGGGNDQLDGGAGADAMEGGAGDDRYTVDNAGDTATDASGVDTVYTTVGHALGAGIERLYADTDTGLALTGNGADNVIVGRGGDDTITRGAGRDDMTGGAGADRFVFQALSDSTVGAARDVIRDFLIGADKIDRDRRQCGRGWRPGFQLHRRGRVRGNRRRTAGEAVRRRRPHGHLGRRGRQRPCRFPDPAQRQCRAAGDGFPALGSVGAATVHGRPYPARCTFGAALSQKERAQQQRSALLMQSDWRQAGARRPAFVRNVTAVTRFS